jgi:hypothetical protein
VRETLKNTVLQVGAWVNVVGYVMNEKPIAKAGARDEGGSNVTAKVQAIMLWDTLTVNLEEYEQAVQARKGAGTTG